MLDLLVTAIVVAFFAAALLCVRGCDSIAERPNREESPGQTEERET